MRDSIVDFRVGGTRNICGSLPAMQFVADLHIHSKYSRATSKDCDLENLAWWAARKGIRVIGTGDFTHPAWYAELQEKLIPAEPGLFRLRPDLEQDVLSRLPPSCRNTVRFLLSVEISTIYKRDERTRKVHHLIYMPSLETAGVFNERLGAIGNIRSDGRPILGLDSRHLLELVLESSANEGYLIPAHIWTPWFAVLGSQSGFDAVDDCYADLASHVFALETGLSSDPEMNWRVSSLDRFRLVSNSDAHSPPALGREATVFDTEIDYFAIRRALETGDGLTGTIEFFPEEGKYHLDGHRKCNVRYEPTETQRHHGICEGCGKPVTVGVLHRVETLADRPEGVLLPGAPEFRSLVQLPQILSEIHGVGPKSKRVTSDVSLLVERLGPELAILQTIPLDQIAHHASSVVVEAITRLRAGKVIRDAGYDGEYGHIRMFQPDEIARRSVTNVLFDIPVAKPTAIDTSLAKHILPPVAQESTSVVVAPSLDADQLEAVAALDGPVLIVAGPGTGKTRTLTHRFHALIKERNVDPRRCLAITFTRRAREELHERLASMLPDEADDITITTFHGLGLSILREHYELCNLSRDFRIVDSLLTSPGELLVRDTVALDELLELPVRLLTNHPEVASQWRARFNWIAVDEYQDIDDWQYQLVRLLTTPKSNICVVGDPDQAIYGFRGADVRFFLRFSEDFPGASTTSLTNNYRSSEAIVKGALQAIAPDTLVKDRQLRSVNQQTGANSKISVHESSSEFDEALYVASTIEQLIGGISLYSFDSGRSDGLAQNFHLSFADIAVLYRTDAQAAPVLEALAGIGIPAQKRSHNRLLDHPGVTSLASALQLHSVADDISVSSLVESIAPDLVDLLEPLAVQCGTDRTRFLTELAMGAEIDTWDPRADRVSLLTLHAAKGLEFPVVFIIGANNNLLPMHWSSASSLTPEQIAEERRLLFVGMTRAQSHLHITYARRRTRNGKTSVTSPSQFLADIDSSLLQRTQTAVNVSPAKQLRLL